MRSMIAALWLVGPGRRGRERQRRVLVDEVGVEHRQQGVDALLRGQPAGVQHRAAPRAPAGRGWRRRARRRGRPRGCPRRRRRGTRQSAAAYRLVAISVRSRVAAATSARCRRAGAAGRAGSGTPGARRDGRRVVTKTTVSSSALTSASVASARNGNASNSSRPSAVPTPKVTTCGVDARRLSSLTWPIVKFSEPPVPPGGARPGTRRRRSPRDREVEGVVPDRTRRAPLGVVVGLGPCVHVGYRLFCCRTGTRCPGTHRRPLVLAVVPPNVPDTSRETCPDGAWTARFASC